MRKHWVGARALVAVALASGLVACGGDDDDAADVAGAALTVALDDDIPSIVDVRDVSCAIGEDGRELVAAGIVESIGDAPHYVDVDVRFVDADGVRVELASDSVSDLLVGEAARWEATTYTDAAPDVRRCEVSATVG